MRIKFPWRLVAIALLSFSLLAFGPTMPRFDLADAQVSARNGAEELRARLEALADALTRAREHGAGR